MPMVRASGGADHVRLDLYGYAYGSATAYGDNSGGNCNGNGRYILKGVYVSKLVGVSGSMSVTYTNGQGQQTTQALSQGVTINIGNSSDVTISWSASQSYRGWSGQGSSGSVSGSIVLDVYF